MASIAQILGAQEPPQKFDHGDRDPGVVQTILGALSGAGHRFRTRIGGPSPAHLARQAGVRARSQNVILSDVFKDRNMVTGFEALGAALGTPLSAGTSALSDIIHGNLERQQPDMAPEERLKRSRQLAKEIGPEGQFFPQELLDEIYHR